MKAKYFAWGSVWVLLLATIGTLIHSYLYLRDLHTRLDETTFYDGRSITENTLAIRGLSADFYNLKSDQAETQKLVSHLDMGVRALLIEPQDTKLRKAVIDDLQDLSDMRKFEEYMTYLESIGAKAEADRLRAALPGRKLPGK